MYIYSNARTYQLRLSGYEFEYDVQVRWVLVGGPPEYYSGKIDPFALLGLNGSGPEDDGWFSSIWNSEIVRYVIPDIAIVGVGFNGILGVGAGAGVDINFITRGPEASFLPIITSTTVVGAGTSIDLTLNIGGVRYTGPVRDIKRDMLITDIRDDGGHTDWVSGGTTWGGKLGGTMYYTPMKDDEKLIGFEFNIGGAIPTVIPVGFAGGISNTFILYDFKKK